ncbi:MAG: hypothetical protein ABIP46_11880 [Polaromonas sp.]
MLSDQFQKIERTSSRNLFLIAAGLVIICQLVAMAMVADGQVKRAELRQAQISAQNVALANCFETSTRFDRNSCMQRTQVDNSPYAVNTVAGNGSDFGSTPSAGSVGGLMNVSFAAR